MKFIRRLFDLAVVAAASALLGMMSYLALGGENFSQKFVPLAELVLIAIFLITIIVNAPNYWKNAKLMIFGLLPVIGLIASAVLPEYFDIEIPIGATVGFYFYLLYYHLFLALTEKKRGVEQPVDPLQEGKPDKKSARKKPKPAKPAKG